MTKHGPRSRSLHARFASAVSCQVPLSLGAWQVHAVSSVSLTVSLPSAPAGPSSLAHA